MTVSVTQFIDAAYPEHGTAEEIQDVVVSTITETGSLADARTAAVQYYRNQAVADRVVQEIVIRDNRIQDAHIMARMPLIDPIVDLGKVGDSRYVLKVPGDYILTEEVYRLIGVDDDGTVVANWQTEREFTIPRNKYARVRGLFKRTVSHEKL